MCRGYPEWSVGGDRRERERVYDVVRKKKMCGRLTIFMLEEGGASGR